MICVDAQKSLFKCFFCLSVLKFSEVSPGLMCSFVSDLQSGCSCKRCYRNGQLFRVSQTLRPLDSLMSCSFLFGQSNIDFLWFNTMVKPVEMHT